MKNWMDAAVSEAEFGVAHGHGGPFGAVVVLKDRIVGRGHNEVLHRNDPTAHAEMGATREACAHLGRISLEGCVLYATGARIGFDDARFFDAMQNPLMPVEHEPHTGAAKLFEGYEGERY